MNFSLPDIKKIRLDWIDGLKAFAILVILLNHFVEPYGGWPWFSNPSYDWPDFEIRMNTLFPEGNNLFSKIIIFLGWLGDMGPGVFILVSGFTLALSQSKKHYFTLTFYKKRLLRIYPIYIVIHLIILIFIWATNQLQNFDIAKIILSFLGLRYEDFLFFYINPSWWFIWLILQLYLFFPVLYKFLIKNQKGFLIGTFVFTILARLAGLLEFTYTDNLYYWMTGMFFGTRLFEFTLGMYLGYLYFRQNSSFLNLLQNKQKVFLYSVLIYITGFGLSLSYAGSLLSNILITVGLSGIFYGIYEYIQSVALKRIVGKIGVLAFPVFLIHQPVIIYIAQNFSFYTSVLLNVSFIILCFPLGYYINQSVDRSLEHISAKIEIIKYYMSLRTTRVIIYTLTLLSICFSSIYFLLDIPDSIYYKLILMATLLLLSFYYFFESNLFATLRISYTFVLILMTGFYLFIFPEQWINHLALIAIPGLLIAMIYPRWAIRLRFNVLYLILAIIFVFSAETWLRENKPFEIGRWGEYPALQKDDRTVYSLIPDKTTHLRYNNYDYVLKTNSLGFNSPEINLKQQKDTNTFRIFVVGDAFSMPEGVEYKKSYPRLLEDKLKKSHPNKSIQVINGGVTGYGPTEMLLQMQTYIDTINPDLIINQIFVNEFAEINYSSKSRLRNIGFRDYSLKEKLFWYSQLSEHIKKNLRDILHQPDLNHYENKSLLFFYNKDSRYYNDTIIDKMDHYLESIKTISRESNSTLLIMYVPGEIEVSKPDHIDYYPHHLNIQDTTKYDLSRPNEIIRRLCRRNDIRLFDTEKILSEHPDQPVYYPRSWHWNAEGHKLIARELTKRINND